jgi:hypothetical protein
MEEGTTSKAIPLRRSRNGTRTVPARSSRRWTDTVTGGVRAVLSPPRQLWLAGLGTTALALRGTRGAWTRLVAEGATAESWLVGLVARAPVR